MTTRPDVSAGTAESVAILRQAVVVLEEAGPARFVANTSLAPGGTIGRHVRHIVEFYDNLLAGLRSGHVDYSRRVRDGQIEIEIGVATTRIDAVIAGLSRASVESPTRPLEVRTESGDAWCSSTLERELQAVISHTVHHLALVAVILRASGFEPPPEFGVGTSTRRHLEGASR